MGVTEDRDDPGLRQFDERGMQENYLILSNEERERGFVRPVRTTYIHLICGTATIMGRDIAETYARDPKFYTGTYCAKCRAHFPVGFNGEFIWDGTSIKVGT